MLYRLHTGRAYEAIERLATQGGSENQIARGAEARRLVGCKDGVAVFGRDLKFGRRKVAPEVAVAGDERE
jgi:hypothetical protein